MVFVLKSMMVAAGNRPALKRSLSLLAKKILGPLSMEAANSVTLVPLSSMRVQL